MKIKDLIKELGKGNTWWGRNWYWMYWIFMGLCGAGLGLWMAFS